MVSGCRTSVRFLPVPEHLRHLSPFCTRACSLQFPAPFQAASVADPSHTRDPFVRKPDCFFPSPGRFSCLLPYGKNKTVSSECSVCRCSGASWQHSIRSSHRQPGKHRALPDFFPHSFGVCRTAALCLGRNPCHSPSSPGARLYGLSLAAGLLPDRRLFRTACAQ